MSPASAAGAVLLALREPTRCSSPCATTRPGNSTGSRCPVPQPDIPDPLDAIERSLLEFIGIIETDPLVRQTFEIMSLRCEYVDEFAGVLQELNKPCTSISSPS